VVTGTITHLDHDRGVGTLQDDEGKCYTFRRSHVRDVWFHDLRTGATVTFEPALHWFATDVRPVTRSV
jgi:cold shock CspA family protein